MVDKDKNPPDEIKAEQQEEKLPPEKPVTDGSPEIKQLVEQMPDVVQDAVNASQQKEKTQAQENLGYKDNKGRAFDPSIHAVDQEGRPVMTPTGRFKQVRPKAVGLSMPDKETSEIVAVGSQYKTVAITVVQIFIQTGFAFFGDDWLPEKSKEINEEANLIEVTASYCQSIGLDDLPPGLVCATAFIAYGLRRFNKPRVKTVREKVGEWLNIKLTTIWLWLQNKKGSKPSLKTSETNKDPKGTA